ncbi:MAG: iron ABC transporter permease [Chloroflexi bacterium AL-W]|nr:iron ABC transporter permease [Chloroflexi bacterium AL-N1]NOK70747.1 iron ABC transporter permease [Chloroflexi bacterium AL-N10]NOK78307.1 iron ABC transporter permease [Chloroflexi bacterium AL-N5]NOK85650.1 iron ABC transporter permease [Chloroflexi bacterium AL-W]NOK92564.1 iron ABC transporter permease [Chloroflexi bacterium AL-N15]
MIRSNAQTSKYPYIQPNDSRPFAVRRFVSVLVISGVAIVLLGVLHIAVGTLDFTPRQIVLALFNQAEDVLHRQVVWGLRLPRALVALLAGGMLGLAGAILQTITRNPLAEPGLMGVSSGAVLAIVLCIAFDGGGSVWDSADSGLILPFVGMVGGLIAGLTVYVLSYQQGSDPMRLVLVGVLIAGINNALISVVLLAAQAEDIQRIVRWTVGSTSGRVWVHWHTIWPVALMAIPLGLCSMSLANVLQLGDNVALGLGLSIERTRFLLLCIAALLTAGAVAVIGGIGFIGLIGPHMARLMVGNDVRRLFPLSIILTAILLIISDIIARTITIGWVGLLTGLDIPDTAGLPVGAVTALLGAPFFLYLLLRGRAAL